MRTGSVKFIFLMLLCSASATPGCAADAPIESVSRVVAISDVHGAFGAMVNTLQQAAVVDKELAWNGGSTQLVVVGDILDRGPNSRAAMDLLMRLETEASAAGGEVRVLIGNHESMLLIGDMRYVSAPEFKAFAAEEDASERSRWLALYAERKNSSVEAVTEQFDTAYPRGYFAMRRAFRSSGTYGSWLLQKDVITVIDGTAFVHGGLSPRVAKAGLQGINREARVELKRLVDALAVLIDAEVLLPTDSHYDYGDIVNAYMPHLDDSAAVLAAIDTVRESEHMLLLDTDGPLWYRGNARCPELIEEYRLEAALAAIGAQRVVVGHTPTPNRQVLQRFEGQLIEIDTGMLGAYYKGSGNALVFENGAFSVVNESGVITKVAAQHPRNVGKRSAGLDATALKKLLLTGSVAKVERPNSAGEQTRVSVSDGSHEVDALFTASKRNQAGVAAYRLDRLLELDMVPVTVMRTIDGKTGSLQFLPKNTVDEVHRAESGRGTSASCGLLEQWPEMTVFDALIYNEGRTRERILYDSSSWRLILSENNLAFGTKKGRPAHLKSTRLAVHPGWIEKLQMLTDAVLQAELGDVLEKKNLHALAARRDRLLSEVRAN
ncbi:MAG: metallophosphoesterase [Gammaproteobacteria bacterium]|nr:metallophosphoesterase [Gammaproteobacteria bacterium]